MGGNGLESYVIRGGREGRDRLGVLARVLAPTTTGLLDRFEPIAGAAVVDAACGGGDVSFELARRVGPTGLVMALDLDEKKLDLARSDAAEAGLNQIQFRVADVTTPWPVRDARLVYARFILTHMTDPALFLRHAVGALAPGGVIVVEDIDIAGRFCHPPSRAVELHDELYVMATQARGADPFIGRRLHSLLETTGFEEISTSLAQPYSRTGEAKMSVLLTHLAIKDGLVAKGFTTRDEADALTAELEAFTARTDTTISMPRIFQAWGTRPLE